MRAPHKLGLKRLAGNVAVTLGRQLISGLLQLATAVIIARGLGPEGNGQYAIVLLLPLMLATFLNLGIGPANVYFLGAKKVSVATVFKVINRLSFIITVADLVIGILCIHFFGQKWFPNVPTNIIWYSLVLFPPFLYQSLLASIFQGLQRFSTFNFILLSQPVITLTGVLLLTFLGLFKIKYIIAISIASLVLTICICLKYVKQEIKGSTVSTNGGSYFKQVLTYGYKAHLSNILAFMNYKADIFLLNYLISPAATGIYVIAVQIVERLWQLSQAASTVILPRLSELSVDEEKRKKITPIVCRSVLMATLLAALLLACVAQPLISIFFGNEYMHAFTALLLLLPGIVAGSGARILANDIAARGRPDLNMYFSILTVTINIAGNLYLIPRYGLAGAATATTIAYMLNLMFRLIVYQKISGNNFLSPLLITSEDISRIKRIFS